jgi:hypothetical protein
MKKGDLVSLRKWDWVNDSYDPCYYHVQFGVLLADITSDLHFCEVFDGKKRVWWDRNCIFPANAKNFVKQIFKYKREK